jgi:hypothetical protein
MTRPPNIPNSIEQLQVQLRALHRQNTIQKEDIDRLKEKRKRESTQLQTTREQLAQRERDLRESAAETAQLRNVVETSGEESNTLRRQVQQLQRQFAQLEREVQDAKSAPPTVQGFVSRGDALAATEDEDRQDPLEDDPPTVQGVVARGDALAAMEDEDRQIEERSFGLGFVVGAFTTWWQSRAVVQKCISTRGFSMLITRVLHRGLGVDGNLHRMPDSLHCPSCVAGNYDNHPNGFRLRTLGCNFLYIIPKRADR